MIKRPKPPRGPRNLKAGGFTNGLWRIEERAASMRRQHRFQETFCSQCGGSFGPRDDGYSHCKDHTPPKQMTRAELQIEVLKLLHELRKPEESTGMTFLRALRSLKNGG
jgi:hypothetical protein